MKIENWNGYDIRFVEKDGEWWAVLKDIAVALGLNARWVKKRLPKDVVLNHPLSTEGGTQEHLVVSEKGIYETIFSSRKPEARAFKDWVFDIVKELRRDSGLEGFQIFRQLDKGHQKAAMGRLKQGLKRPVRVDFIKANTIANKAVSDLYGYPKMVKKGDMSARMLTDRECILDDTVELMQVKDKYGLNISVKDGIYARIEGGQYLQ